MHIRLMQSHSPISFGRIPNATTLSNDSKETPIADEKQEKTEEVKASYFGSSLKQFVALPKGKKGLLKTVFNSLRIVANIGIVSYAALNIPAAYKGAHEVARYLGKQPEPTLVSNTTEIQALNGIPFDYTIVNYKKPNFYKIFEQIKEADLHGKELDLDNSGVIGDQSAEIRNLINELTKLDPNKFKSAIKFLDEADVASQVLWGIEGPNPYYTEQRNEDNCQVISAIQALCITPKNNQALKEILFVTNFNPSKGKFKIDTIVKLKDGQIIEIPYEKLYERLTRPEEWLSNSKDGSLVTTILTSAIEEGLKPYSGVPNDFLSAPLTLITGEDYCSINLKTLTDSELINILNKAPSIPTQLSTSENLFLTNPLVRSSFYILGTIGDYWDIKLTNLFDKRTKLNASSSVDRKKVFLENETNNSQPSFKIIEFYKNCNDLLEKIELNKKNPILIDQSKKLKSNRLQFENNSPKYLTENHVYTVKDFKNVDGEYITTIMDSNDQEKKLTLSEVRQLVKRIVCKSSDAPNINIKAINKMLLSGLTLAFLNYPAGLIGLLSLAKKRKTG